MKDVEVKTPGGVILGNAMGFDLDDPAMDGFFKRLGQGLLHEATKIGYEGPIHAEWKLVDDSEKTAAKLCSLPIPPYRYRVGAEFDSLGYFHRAESPSLWIVQFYQGPIFKVMVNHLEPDENVTTCGE